MRGWIAWVVPWSLWLARPFVVHAEAAAPLRLADVLTDVRAHSPTIQAAQERARAAAATPARMSAYDDPVVSWESWNVPESGAIDRADNNIVRLSQKVPFPGKRTLAGRAAEHDADVMRAESRGVELDTIAAVKRAYFDLWQAHQNLRIYDRDQALAQHMAHVAEQRYGVGGTSQADVLRAQLEVTHMVNRVTSGTLAIDGARAELNTLLDRRPDEPLGVPEELPLPHLDVTPEALTDRALTQRPELEAQAAVIAREETSLRLARRSYLPDFEFAVGRFFNAGRSDGFGAMASVSVPLAYRAKYDAGVAEATARLASAQAERRRLEDLVRREVRQAFLRARAALLQRDLFVTTHIPQAEQSLRVTESAYQANAVDFLTLIDAVRAIESSHVEHIMAESELAKAGADLERAVGADVAPDAVPAGDRP